MKKIQSLEEFDKELRNEEIPNFNTNLIYNKVNNKGSVFMFKFKKVALVTCISVLTCSSLVFAATKLSNTLYNNKGEKIFEVSSADKSLKENPDSLDSNQVSKDLISKFSSESYLAESGLKEGKMLLKVYKGKGLTLLDSTINIPRKDNVIYHYNSKLVDFYSFDEFKNEVGNWAKLPKYLPADSQFTNARIRYSVDPELISQLRKEMIAELETKTEGFTYRVIQVPKKSVMRNMLITFTSEKYGNFSISIFHGAQGLLTPNDELVSKLTLENSKEAIVDKSTGRVIYADDSQLRETSQLSPITWLDKPLSAEFEITKTPLIYSVKNLSVKSLDEVKKILESIE